MAIDSKTILDQRRFQPPENWDWSFRSFEGGVRMRYGQPRSRKAFDAVAVIVGGLGDFGEQYFELANEMAAKNIKPIIIDLPGQGGSSRYLPDEPMKRHSQGFDEALSQLGTVIDEVVLSAAIDMEDNHKRLPIILLAHSLGGHMALRYLAENNKSSRGYPIFSAAAVVAPMLGMKAVNMVPPFLRGLAIQVLVMNPTGFVPGGCAWFDGYRERPGFKGIFTSDPERYELQRVFFTHPDTKQVATGSPTNKWLYDAYQSCKTVAKDGYLEKIGLPVLIGLAGDDRLVDNSAIRKASQRIKSAELLEVPAAQHEILMEADQFRKPFVERFFTFIEENVLNKPDKGKSFIQ